MLPIDLADALADIIDAKLRAEGWPRSRSWRPRATRCHMVSDENEFELHDFAAKLGLKREWFQVRERGASHYDITPRRRRAAVAAGAVEVSVRELVLRSHDSRVRRNS